MTTTKKYPGRLAKSVPRAEAMAMLDECSGDSGGFDFQRYATWRDGKWAQATADLFRHYQIPPESPHRWIALSLALAFDHVPAFRIPSALDRQPGRPRTKIKRSRAGRPRKWNTNDYLALFASVEAQRQSAELHGRGSVRKAIEMKLRADAKSKGRSEQKALQTIGYWESRYSEAKSLFRKLAENKK